MVQSVYRNVERHFKKLWKSKPFDFLTINKLMSWLLKSSANLGGADEGGSLRLSIVLNSDSSVNWHFVLDQSQLVQIRFERIFHSSCLFWFYFGLEFSVFSFCSHIWAFLYRYICCHAILRRNYLYVSCIVLMFWQSERVCLLIYFWYVVISLVSSLGKKFLFEALCFKTHSMIFTKTMNILQADFRL